MSFKHVIYACGLATVIAVLGSLAPALAVGSGSSGATPIVCSAGWEYDAVQKICVPCPQGTVYNAATKTCINQNSSVIDDDRRFEQGNALALAGQYDDALEMLNAIEDKDDAMVLTMIGYATRKLGRFEEGIAYYMQALAIEPDSLNTHEYLGEAYVSLGRDDLAGVQLSKIEAICGTSDCEHYVKLADFMTGDGIWH